MFKNLAPSWSSTVGITVVKALVWQLIGCNIQATAILLSVVTASWETRKRNGWEGDGDIWNWNWNSDWVWVDNNRIDPDWAWSRIDNTCVVIPAVVYQERVSICSKKGHISTAVNEVKLTAPCVSTVVSPVSISVGMAVIVTPSIATTSSAVIGSPVSASVGSVSAISTAALVPGSVVTSTSKKY
jgi:hypothetical protein